LCISECFEVMFSNEKVRLQGTLLNLIQLSFVKNIPNVLLGFVLKGLYLYNKEELSDLSCAEWPVAAAWGWVTSVQPENKWQPGHLFWAAFLPPSGRNMLLFSKCPAQKEATTSSLETYMLWMSSVDKDFDIASRVACLVLSLISCKVLLRTFLHHLPSTPTLTKRLILKNKKVLSHHHGSVLDNYHVKLTR